MIASKVFLSIACLLILLPEQSRPELIRAKRQGLGLNPFENAHHNPPCGIGHYLQLDPITRNWYCVECPEGTHIFEREHFKQSCEENGQGATPSLKDVLLPDGDHDHGLPCGVGHFLDYDVKTRRYFCGHCPEGTHMHQDSHLERTCVEGGASSKLPDLLSTFIAVICAWICVHYRM